MENPANVSVFMSRPLIAHVTSTLPNVRFPAVADIEAAIARTFGLVSAMGGKRTFGPQQVMALDPAPECADIPFTMPANARGPGGQPCKDAR
jgi:hypothetical protein